MSYCRWSSDDYQCDVYVYESDRGFETHVAGRRHTFSEPLPPAPPKGDIDAAIRRMMAVTGMCDRAEPVDIGLPYDGESYTDATASECADRLEMLRAAGYNVPQYAIDALREEAGAA